MMFICELCSFCTTTRREWNNHKKKTGHALATQPSDDRDEEDLASDSEMDFPVQQEVLNVAMLHGREEELDVDASDDLAQHFPQEDLAQNSPPPDDFPHNRPLAEDSWYPWLSRSHYYLTVFYHGSHR